MDARPQSLSALRETGAVWNAERSHCGPYQITNHIIPFWNKTVQASIPNGGLLNGAIHQAVYHAAFPPLAFGAHIAHQSCTMNNKAIFWIGKTVWPTPHFLCEIDPSGVLFQRSLFIETISEKKTLWAIQEASLSPAVGLIVTSIKKIQTVLLKQFSVKLKSHRGTILLLQPNTVRAPTAAVSSSWDVFPHQTELSYYRGAGIDIGRWSTVELFARTHPDEGIHISEQPTVQRRFG